MKDFLKHRASRMLLGCMLVQGAGIGITFNCIGVFMVAICADQGFSTTAFSAFSSIRALCTALILPFISRLVYERWPAQNRYFVVGFGSLSFLALAAGALVKNVEAWYVIGILMGIGGVLFNVNQAYVITNWCEKRRNLFIGLAGASSGIVGFVFNPIASALIQALGWQLALLILCGVGLAAVWVGGSQMRLTPEEVGLSPYGHGEAEQSQSALKDAQWVEYPRKELRRVTGLLLFVFLTGNVLATCLPHLPNYAGELGYDLTVASLFSSFAMAGNMVGKIGMGALCDRFPLKRVALACYAFQTLALFTIACFRESLPVALFCSFFMGASQSTVNVLMHMTVRNLYGRKKYVGMFSSVSAVSAIVAAPMFTLAGYSYDHTGSYFTSLMVMGGMYALSCAALMVIFFLRSKAKTSGHCSQEARCGQQVAAHPQCS